MLPSDAASRLKFGTPRAWHPYPTFSMGAAAPPARQRGGSRPCIEETPHRASRKLSTLKAVQCLPWRDDFYAESLHLRYRIMARIACDDGFIGCSQCHDHKRQIVRVGQANLLQGHASSKSGCGQGIQQRSHSGFRELELRSSQNLSVFRKDLIIPRGNKQTSHGTLKNLIAYASRGDCRRHEHIRINHPKRRSHYFFLFRLATRAARISASIACMEKEFVSFMIASRCTAASACPNRRRSSKSISDLMPLGLGGIRMPMVSLPFVITRGPDLGRSRRTLAVFSESSRVSKSIGVMEIFSNSRETLSSITPAAGWLLSRYRRGRGGAGCGGERSMAGRAPPGMCLRSNRRTWLCRAGNLPTGRK